MPEYLGAQSGLEGDVIIMGFPFDHGATTHSGCSLGPSVLRQLSSFLGLKQGYIWDQKSRKKLLEGKLITDAGDLSFSARHSREAYLANIRKVANEILKSSKKALFLGGDHLVAYPLIRAVDDIYADNFQVIQIDAHLDMQRVEYGDLPTHANFMSFIMKETRIKRLIQVGIRTLSREMPEMNKNVYASEVSELKEIILPGVPVYLTIDTDGFDPSIAAAVGHPVWGGLRWSDLSSVLETIRDLHCPLIAADWTEYNPKLDTENYLCAQGILSKQLSILQELQNSISL